MVPEQVLAAPVDGRTDLYAAAIVLYEALCGHTPFGDESVGELVLRHRQVSAAPAPIRTWLAQAPAVLDALFVRALAKRPDDRFDNAIDMGDAFRSALGAPESLYWRALVDLARAA